ncbi:hypothetical protein ScPMuIL_007752 [Solemya velum]
MAIRFNLICLWLFSAVLTVSSLKCYVCDSTSAGEKCGQYPELTAGDTKYIADCHRNSVCKKSEIDDDGDISVVRACSSYKHNTTCIEEVVGDRITYICYCNKDHCNGSDVNTIYLTIRPSLIVVSFKMATHMSIIALFLFSIFVSGYGLKCFSCDSATYSARCDENSELTSEDTDLIADTCNTTCKKSQVEDAQGIATVRTCSAFERENGCEEETVDDYSVNVCYCNTDLCNKGGVQNMPFAFSSIEASNVDFLDSVQPFTKALVSMSHRSSTNFTIMHDGPLLNKIIEPYQGQHTEPYTAKREVRQGATSAILYKIFNNELLDTIAVQGHLLKV